MKKKFVVLTGAGISAESGISTFRDAGGLWEKYDIMEVASIEGWYRQPALVLDFYNERRRQLLSAAPNPAHLALVNLEKKFDVHIITQNVDDLHERAGSTHVLHLHGELLKARSTGDPTLIYEWKKDINLGDTCEKGFQLRPHIVWFGELVPLIEVAANLVAQADFILIVGTSMQVYPAAGLIAYAKSNTPLWYIDPSPTLNHEFRQSLWLRVIPEKASVAIPRLIDELTQN